MQAPFQVWIVKTGISDATGPTQQARRDRSAIHRYADPMTRKGSYKAGKGVRVAAVLLIVAGVWGLWATGALKALADVSVLRVPPASQG